MGWKQVIGVSAIFAAIIIGPFVIGANSLAQALYSLLTTGIATAIGVWASWNYSRNSDKERLTRYGLLAWRNVDALSVKVRQQIQTGSANTEMLQSWLLDIDQAKWGWRDLLRELFELQERLELEKEEISQKYKDKIETAESDEERRKLENQSRLEQAKISARAPLPIPDKQQVDCPNCGKSVAFTIGSEPGASAWPTCTGCNALFPVHRKTDTEVAANGDAVKLPTKAHCPHCKAENEWKVPANRSVHFIYHCTACKQPMQCQGTSTAFSASVPDRDG